MTAVEWLTDKFYANEGIMKSEWLEKAKEMEKSQQFWNYMRGLDDGCQNKVQNSCNNNNK